MSASPSAASAVPLDQPRLAKPAMLLVIGAVFIGLTALGIFVPGYGAKSVAYSWLIGVTFWTAITIGCLLLVMIHHIFDAGWSTVVRRTLEHWLASFTWLAVLFVPLLIVVWTEPSLVWKWMDVHFDLSAIGGHGMVGDDVLYQKKSGFLNRGAFTVCTIIFYLAWIWLSARLRKHSFAQDDDGRVEHTFSNRKTAAFGIPVAALTLSFAAFYWLMSLEYHWFSTMYGVWFFAGCARSALAIVTLLCLYLVSKGALRGIFTTAHMLNLGNIMLAFTVFWAYVTFSQYFLIWNANVPEETFWYHLREVALSTGEKNVWWIIGLVLLFGHFFVPFFFFLQHPLKKKAGTMAFICFWILAVQLLDFIYNIVPAQKLPNGDAIQRVLTPWDMTAVIGIGAICLWAFFTSFARTRVIPIRDPRIVESLSAHE